MEAEAFTIINRGGGTDGVEKKSKALNLTMVTGHPNAVTAEAETCWHLLHQYVDHVGDDFAILKTADKLKDFSRIHLAGLVGAGISYLR